MSESKQVDPAEVTRRAIAAVRQLKQRVAALEAQAREPIAVVAMACRLPGGATPEAFWDSLIAGRDMIQRVPDERLLGPWPEGVPRWAGLLDEVANFDPAFFNISPREALTLDPQQRLLLELAWEGFERAGIVPAQLRASKTGVFVGLCNNDYADRVAQRPADQRGVYDLLGTAASTAAGRLSYVLGLQGPAVSVDTACSSSLVTLHLACQSLRARESKLALAGGVSLILSERSTEALSHTHALAPDGRCKTFSAAANGFVRGEGGGLLVLERLSDARRNGHPVLALIRGSAVNQDGRSTGLTAPNVLAQETLLRDALSAAGLEPHEIDYLECHGTGTSLGDPIEVAALRAVFGEARTDAAPLHLGSVKSNIGHLESAAGVAGVIKVILALREQQLPGTLHLRHLNPRIEIAGTPLSPLFEAKPWPRRGQAPRRAGVSSFGISGTNAHVILEGPSPQGQPQTLDAEDTEDANTGPVLIPLSARSEAALAGQARALRAYLEQERPPTLRELGAALARGRSHFELRAGLVVDSHEQLRVALDALATGASHPSTVRARAKVDGGLVFVFPGQGSQWTGMATQLLEHSPAFRAALEACTRALEPHTGWRLLELLERGELEGPDQIQPALFAVMVALAAMWRERGVVPDAVVGHSQGEIAAACVAGALSLEDAAKVVALRAQLIAAHLRAGTMAGAMAAVSLSAEQLAPHLAAYEGRLALAVDNGPASTVVAGEPEAVEDLLAELDALDVFARRVKVSYASHCAKVEVLREQLLEALADLRPRSTAIPMVSSVSGQPLAGETLDAEYWYQNLRQSVDFAGATRELIDSGHRLFVELSPHPLLRMALDSLLEQAGVHGAVVASLRRNEGGPTRVQLALAQLHCSGYTLDWDALLGSERAPALALPTYAFARERYWIEAERGRALDLGAAGIAAVDHALLRAKLRVGEGDTRVLSASVSLLDQPWLADHGVFDRPVLPGACFAELALAAAREAWPEAPCLVLDELVLMSPLVLDQGEQPLQVLLSPPTEQGGRELTIYSQGDEHGPPRRHAIAHVGPEERSSLPVPAWPPSEAVELDVEAMHSTLEQLGLRYGPAFRALRRAWRSSTGELFGELELGEHEARSARGFCLHPALLDASFQLMFFTGELDAVARAGSISLPFSMHELQLQHGGVGGRLRVRARVSEGEQGLAASFDLWDERGKLVASLAALETRTATVDSLEPEGASSELLRVEWELLDPDASATLDFAATVPGAIRWAFIGEDPVLEELTMAGHAVSCYASWEQLCAAIDADPDLRPDAIVRCWTDAHGDADHGARACTLAGLAELRSWMARPELADARLLWLTSHAIAPLSALDSLDSLDSLDFKAAHEDALEGLAHSALWGLARSARAEAPERTLKLLDLDASSEGHALLIEALLHAEPEFLIRADNLYVSRLRPVQRELETQPLALELSARTVLITGGTGELGAQLCRHLVRRHGARHLLLCSRRGLAAPGAEALIAELRGLGASSVDLATCDVGDREALETVLATIPERRPLGAVFHVAGLLDDALITTLEPEQLERVLRPKVAGAWNLHELTRAHELSAFVMFSSAAGVLGNAGQGNYAAANAFLDSLAWQRRREGLPAHSLAWGLWSEGGMIAHLDGIARARLRRSGLRPLSVARGMQLLDAALAREEAVLAPIDFDAEALRERRASASLPPILSELVTDAPASGAREQSGSFVSGEISRPREDASAGQTRSLIERLAAAPLEQREALLLELVGEHVAAILHLAGSVDPDQPLQELGLDSLMAVEIRNRLQLSTGLRLPSTLLFDHPSPRELAAYLQPLLEGLLPEQHAEPIAEPPPRVEAKPARASTSAPARSPELESDPIAIVAMACRYPGGVDTLEDFWQLLEQGRDAIAEFPRDRGWQLDTLYDPDPSVAGKSVAREGGFLYEVADFDPAFFNISPREAEVMDPQHRLLLELAWIALEQAGIVPRSLRRSNTGVYVGVMYQDYGDRLLNDLEALDGSVGINSSTAVASGRLAYTLGLEGPAMTIDTACSSSLVALHLACQALRSGECELALAGGATVMATPRVFVEFSRQGGMARDGRCKSFSSRADGAGWSEGAGLLVLERLSDARRNGHPVLALVRGSAVNQDGRSQGLTAPNGPSQQRVIQAALRNAGLVPSDVDAVEAHGTGTPLGDPIEVGALQATYGRQREPERPLWLGSVKSNLGHTQAAAGVAGVIKMVLSMQRGQLPRTLHADERSPHIEWDGSIELLDAPRPWPAEEGSPRRAGVSSFGVSGTNAHVILEQASEANSGPRFSAPQPPAALPLLLSARSEAALRGQARRLRAHLDAHPELSVLDLGYSLARSRTHFEQRACVAAPTLASERAALLEALEALAAGRPHPLSATGRADLQGKLVFVFPGQGSQWAGMADALLEQSLMFRRTMEDCARALDPHTGWSLMELVRSGGFMGAGAARVQPVLFAMMVSLAAVWRELGVVPDAVIGHSQGEIAAACVAGALSLGDAAKIVARRSRVIEAELGPGAMAVVSLSAAELDARLANFDAEDLALAVDNGPASTVVSGSVESVTNLVAQLEAEGVFARRVKVDYASHHPGIEALEAPLARALAGLRPRELNIPMMSTVEVRALAGAELDADYWYRNLRQPVRFCEGIEALYESGHRVFVELSPHPLMGVALAEILGARGRGASSVLDSLERGHGGLDRLMRSLGQLHCRGRELDVDALLGPCDPRLVPLPSYAFDRTRHWLERPKARGGADVREAGLAPVEHALLGASTSLGTSDTHLLSARVSLPAAPWLEDHRVFDELALPAAGFAELALSAARELWPQAPALVLDELIVLAPLTLAGKDAELRVQLVLEPEPEPEPDAEGEARSLHIYARNGEGSALEHACGRVRALDARSPDLERRALAWPPLPAELELELEPVYTRLEGLGLRYGPSFRGLRRVWRSAPDELLAELELPAELDAEGFALHPALLDAALQLTAFIDDPRAQLDGDTRSVRLPFALDGLELHASGATRLRVSARASWVEDKLRMSFEMWDPSGRLVARLTGLETRPASAAQVRAGAESEHLYELGWDPRRPEGLRPALPTVWIGEELGLTPPDGSRYTNWAALVEAFERGDLEPHTRVLRCWSAPARVEPASLHTLSETALDELQQWLAEPTLAQTELVWLTHHGAASVDQHAPASALAPLWGLARSARSERPERSLRLLDCDTLARPALDAAMGIDEPELMLRDGVWLAPRLRPVSGSAPASELRLRGATLITGGTGELGAALARHLVRTHGASDLVLTSRRGLAAPGAAALRAELYELGAQRVDVRACDVADASALAGLLAELRRTRPLSAVFHVAGLLDDGVVAQLRPEQLHAALRPKLDGAWNLHFLSASDELEAFVMFSSAAGLLGNAGQANYAAANTFLDALAHQRVAAGLPGLSLSWGLWAEGGMIAALRDEDLARLRRQGARPLSIQRGMALLDAAMRRARGPSPSAHLAPIEFDRRALRARRERGELPRVLESLVPTGLRRAGRAQTSKAASSKLVEQLATLPELERGRILLEQVSAEIQTVLRLPETPSPERPLGELGLDSLLAIEVRNGLQRMTGLRLPSTLLFDHPSARALSVELARLLTEQTQARAPSTSAARMPVAAGERDDPIAIVAMACRFPGGVDSPEALWELLAEGRDAIAGFPTDRGWDIDRLYDADPSVAGKSVSREGGFLYDAACFDPSFFGISPREAQAIDPQQRVLLELAWEALERGGIVPAQLRGSQTGVYVGIMYGDYGGRFITTPEALDGYLGTGSSASVASGRIAYTLGLEGPAMTVDTACSSSLVTLHLACQALRAGECELALAGGATIMATPNVFVEFSRLQGMAPDGRCKSFSAAADGAGWGEGAGLLVLERLSDARRKSHQVLAIVRGSAINQDGRSQGLTVPNGPAQQRVIEAALASARLQPAQVDAVEAHGTGTKLGDPIEAGALLATYGRQRSPQRPLWLGSVKSNLGHTQAAAGVAGVIKMVLAMRHAQLPRTLHVDEPSALVDWEGGVALAREAQPWMAQAGEPRRAGVSSFGISGTNAHVILEQPEHLAPEIDSPQQAPERPLPILVSARDAAGLHRQLERLAALERSPQAPALPELARGLALARTHFEQRACLMVRSQADLREQLDAALAGTGELLEGRAADAGEGQGALVFVFPGQGSQWLGMAAQLLEQSAPFAAAIEACADALAPHIDWDLLAVLRGDEPELLARVEVVQPALFSMMVALAAQWRALGVEPDAVVGHSQGEIAAACVAGALSLADAAKVVALRSQLIASELGAGAMAAVGLSAEELATWLAPYGARLALAVDNGPASCAVSGEAAAVDELVELLGFAGVFARKIKVSYASHCAQVERLRTKLLTALDDIAPRRARLPMISTVDGSRLAGPELDAAYWYQNLRETVHFAGATRSLLDTGHRFFVELNPHPLLGVALESLLEQHGVADRGAVVASLRRDEGSLERLEQARAQLHCHGYHVDWSSAFEPNAGEHGSVPGLPTYAFARERYWLDAPEPAQPQSESQPDVFWNLVEDGGLDALGSALELDAEGQAALARLVPALASWRRRSQARNTATQMRYALRWRSVAPTPHSPASEGPWLVLVSEHLAHSEAERLAAIEASAHAAGIQTVRVHVCETDTPEQLAARLAEHAPSLMLSLLALDERELAAHPGLPCGLALNLSLAQAITRLEGEVPLWLASSGAVACEADEPVRAPLQATSWGFGRSLALERGRQRIGLIDLPLQHESLTQLPAALTRTDEESQLALRGGVLRVPRVVELPSTAPASPLRVRGSALITGGTGALGAHLARNLAAAGAELLVLTSRRGLAAPGAKQLVAELESRGTAVRVEACDASSPTQLRALLNTLESEGAPPLRTVVHAAGVAGELGSIESLSRAQLSQTIAVKVAGARALDELTRELQLDHFVCFSSISAVWGSGPQAAYAAGNAFLDALAHQRAAAGLPARSIAWGLWGEGGMGSSETAVEQLTRLGLRPFSPAEGVAGFELALADPQPCSVFVDVDWSRFVPTYRAARPRPLFDELKAVRNAEPAAASAQAHAKDDLRAQLEPLAPDERTQLLLEFVLRHTAAVLGFAADATPDLDPRVSFSAHGLDSVMAVELRARLQQHAGVSLPATLAFDYPSPTEVCELLAERLMPAAATAAGSQPEPEGLAKPTIPNELDELAEDDLLEAVGRFLGDVA